MSSQHNRNPARGRGQNNRGGHGPNPPPPPPPNPQPKQKKGGKKFVSKRTGKDVMVRDQGSENQALTASLEAFAASFATAGEARILPTPTPNYANSMAFHKVIPIGGNTGLFSGIYNRMFIIDPYKPWTAGVTVIDEREYSGSVPLAEGVGENGKDFKIVPKISVPLSCSGTDADGKEIQFTNELQEQPGCGITAWRPDDGRLFPDAFWVQRDIRFLTLDIDDNDNHIWADVGDQTTATGALVIEFYNPLTAAWEFVPNSTSTAVFANSKTTFKASPGQNNGDYCEGTIRAILNVTNTAALGTIRSFGYEVRLTNVSAARLNEQLLPLCSQADVSEVIDVWGKSSHVRLGSVAFWMEPTAAGLTNGGSVLAAQVLKSTHFSHIPSIAFAQLSELPDRVHVGKFKEGAYGWYNPDRILDLEFKKPEIFQTTVSDSASVLVIVVKPENLADAGQSYLFKINSNYNYRWQSRVFRPILTPCSWELLQRLLVVNAAYCNVGCNPAHVNKIRSLCRDFASNPENRRIAMDVFRMMKPGLKGMANGIGETFIPGYNILRGAIEPYL